jgi:hypothetical protein
MTTSTQDTAVLAQHISNWPELQSQLLNYLEQDQLHPWFWKPADQAAFYYLSSAHVLEHCPALVQALAELGLTEVVMGMAVNRMMPGDQLPIHVDTAGFRRSLNLPVQFEQPTVTRYWDVQGQPLITKRTRAANSVEYLGVEHDQACQEVLAHELTGPALILVNQPHNSTNPSTTAASITVLIRVAHDPDNLI